MAQHPDEPLSPYLGDHPDGAYWSAVEVGGPDDAPPRRDPRQPVQSTATSGDPRSPVDPYPIRMFAEIGCDFALWGVIDESPPTRREGSDGGETIEDELPVTAGLRLALRAWARDHFRWDGGDKTIAMGDFDERGFRLSRDLQRELGELYAVTYRFTFAGPHREALLQSVADDPLPGWRCPR